MKHQKQQYFKLALTTLSILSGIIVNQSAFAQLKPDHTLGSENSVVNKVNEFKDIINGGAARGANLFHSFEKFNVGENRSVYFTNPTGIENILTRVTGGNVSNILGILGVEGTANLFLINPNGIIFGQNASLDIRGSFTATTADEIKLGDNGLFSATAPATSNLLNIQPSALFRNALRNQLSEIKNEGNLQVDDGKNITLFSANVTNTGTLTANKGTIQLTGAENLKVRGGIETGTLLLNTKNLIIGEDDNATIDKTTLESLSGNTNLIFQAKNDITINPLNDHSLSLADGSGKVTFTADANADGVGNFQMETTDTIKTNGRDISISGANLILGNIDTLLVKGGDIITVIDIDAGGDIPFSRTATFTFTVSEEQPIENLDVQFSAKLNYAGTLEISLTSPSEKTLELFRDVGFGENFQDTLLDDSAATGTNGILPPFLGAFRPTGKSGLAIFNGENPTGIWQLKVTNDSFGNNNGTLYKAGETASWGKADGTKLIFRTPITAIGDSGAITLNARSGNINVGKINANSLTGNGGKVNLAATENINLNGSLAATNHINIFADADSNGNGNLMMNISDTIQTNGKKVEIKGTNLTLGNINTSFHQGGGNITLTAAGGNISTQNLLSASFSRQGTTGNGGHISLTAGGHISTQNLLSTSFSNGGIASNGGGISLTAGGNISTQNLLSASFSFAGTAGNGGDISLSAGGDILTQNLESYSTSFEGTAGNGGDISLSAGGNISTQLLESYTSSDLSKEGNGGGISLFADGDISTNSLFSYAYSFSGQGGNGGRISFFAGGNISTKNLLSASFSPEGIAGNGGEMNLNAMGGDIFTQFLDSHSFSRQGTAGNGGRISLFASSDISTQSLHSYSFSDSGTGGNGGEINLNAMNGNIQGIKNEYSQEFPVFHSFSISQTGQPGQAGNVTLAAKNQITNLDILTLSSDSKSGDVQVQGFGNLSLTNIDIITTKQVTLNESFGGENIVILEVGGVGQSGNVTFASTGNLTFNNSRIDSDTNGSDPAGNVTITSPSIVTFNNSKIASNTNNKGKAGSVQINAKKLTLTDASEISASTTADGQAGDITLNTATLTVANGAEIFATTTSSGDGGTITINAEKAVNLGIGVQDSSPILSVETSGAGKAGNIILNTPSLTVSDTARITATATKNATNTKGGGSITLNASKINLAGVVGVFAETQGQAPAGTLQLNPYENQPDLDITLFPKSIISASTTASGKGGDLIITAPENINISGQGKLAVETSGRGDAGNIQISTKNLNLSDGVKISASTFSSGKGGNIIVQVKDNITLNGTDTGLFASTEPGSIGDSGSIDIDPQTLIIKNGAGIGVNSQGSGEGGDVSIQVGTLNLDNKGFISAETASNQGGNINLNIPDLLLFRNNSQITATAGTNGAGGDGGNININTPFIIAFPSENSDITANAFKGNGGKINITTNAIFGLEYQPQLTSKSDITASSDFGLAGDVEINTPDIDPTSGLIELPGNLVNAESLLGKDICSYEQRAKQNSFTITGKGGLPAESDELISNSPGMVEWVIRSDKQETTPVGMKEKAVNQEEANIKNPIIQEAQGWIITADGKVILTAETPKVTLQNSGLNHSNCH
ncbi:filamentous hemagglutinin N-terminal domain-containing protein [Anabaena sp. UHCC 0451]|uniref:two-partner secretion domain-containing protein n=1 Tax=Anabaena sp. UHCC 0451 TaxID=2055235 RepID=UPI002B20CB75|nr:filamentous hemagglutinin N-terminal domain-containing protein [Anabaena sp. UHCC 0451]MEA5578180.1 filamentous hemagglutinin N-terminal domain-containing protein [Anabaena sp. UHCC 0451]